MGFVKLNLRQAMLICGDMQEIEPGKHRAGHMT